MRLGVKKRLWVVVCLLAVIALLMGGCKGHPEGIKSLRWLTEAEKERIVEIALNTPQAKEWLEKESHYRTRLGWIAVVWDSSGYEFSQFWAFDYETVETRIPRGVVDVTPEGSKERIVRVGVPDSAALYSLVTINFGEPPRWQISVAVNPDTEKVALVQQNPYRTGPTPPEETIED